MINEKSKQLIIHAIILFIVLIIFGLIIFGVFSYFSSDVAFVEYHAYYNTELDLTSIADELTVYNISYQYGIYRHPDGYLNEYIECNFGKNFTGVFVHDTHCYIYRNNTFEREDVSVRLYGMDGRDDSEMKLLLEKSMDYITDFIYNATGQYPSHFRFYYEDGPPLKYPDNNNTILMESRGGKHEG